MQKVHSRTRTFATLVMAPFIPELSSPSCFQGNKRMRVLSGTALADELVVSV